MTQHSQCVQVWEEQIRRWKYSERIKEIERKGREEEGRKEEGREGRRKEGREQGRKEGRERWREPRQYPSFRGLPSIRRQCFKEIRCY